MGSHWRPVPPARHALGDTIHGIVVDMSRVHMGMRKLHNRRRGITRVANLGIGVGGDRRRITVEGELHLGEACEVFSAHTNTAGAGRSGVRGVEDLHGKGCTRWSVALKPPDKDDLVPSRQRQRRGRWRNVVRGLGRFL